MNFAFYRRQMKRAEMLRRGADDKNSRRLELKKLAQTGPSEAELEGTRMKRPKSSKRRPASRKAVPAEIGQGRLANATQP